MSNWLSYTDAYGDELSLKPTLNFYLSNNNLAVGLTEYDKELEIEDSYCMLTVNVDELPYLYAAIDTTYGGEQKLQFLKDHALAEPTGEVLHSGFCTYPVYRFNEEKLREIDPNTFKAYQKAHGRESSLDQKIKTAQEKKELQSSGYEAMQHENNRERE